MFRQLKWSAIASSLVYMIIGILLIVFPDVSGEMVSLAAGIGLAAYGVLNLIIYFTLKVQDSLYRNEFVKGITMILFGILFMVKRDFLMDLVPVILGLAIVLSGLVKLQNAVVSERIGYNSTLPYVVLSLISIIFGIVIMFFLTGKAVQAVLFRVIGAAMVYCGCSDIFSTMYLAGKFDQYVKHFEEEHRHPDPNVIDTEVHVTPEDPEDGYKEEL